MNVSHFPNGISMVFMGCPHIFACLPQGVNQKTYEKKNYEQNIYIYDIYIYDIYIYIIYIYI